MKETINYYYNVYPDEIVEINNGCYFYYGEFKYYFVKVKNIEELSMLLDISNTLYKKNTLVDTFIFGKNKSIYVSLLEDNYVLLRVNSVENDVYSLSDIVYFNSLYVKDNIKEIPYDKIWAKNVDVFESEVSELNNDYMIVQDSFNYYVGLAENAISYYVDVKEKESLNDIRVSVCHKRINKYMYSGLINNPLYFTLDYEVRDIALYIQTMFFEGVFNFEEIIDCIKGFNRTMARILICRLLYPVYYFDQLKLVLMGEESENSLLKYIEKCKEYELLLSDLLNYFNKKLNIPKIEWIQK